MLSLHGISTKYEVSESGVDGKFVAEDLPRWSCSNWVGAFERGVNWKYQSTMDLKNTERLRHLDSTSLSLSIEELNHIESDWRKTSESSAQMHEADQSFFFLRGSPWALLVSISPSASHRLALTSWMTFNICFAAMTGKEIPARIQGH